MHCLWPSSYVWGPARCALLSTDEALARLNVACADPRLALVWEREGAGTGGDAGRAASVARYPPRPPVGRSALSAAKSGGAIANGCQPNPAPISPAQSLAFVRRRQAATAALPAQAAARIEICWRTACGTWRCALAR